MTSQTNIALDGPLNGTYINAKQAEDNGYTLTEWQEGEFAYLHTATAETFNDDGVPAEVMAEIDETL